MHFLAVPDKATGESGAPGSSPWRDHVGMTTLAKGDVAPSFSLPDQDGAIVGLGDYANRRVVVYFYPADDTPGCTKEACQFSDLAEEYAASGVEVLGISPDGGSKHERFRAKYGLRIALLSDPEHEVMTRYGAFGPKTTFLVGRDGRIERAWYNVRADGHAAKVLEALAG
jgi:peroxiredoxin Q/BCP